MSRMKYIALIFAFVALVQSVPVQAAEPLLKSELHIDVPVQLKALKALPHPDLNSPNGNSVMRRVSSPSAA